MEYTLEKFMHDGYSAESGTTPEDVDPKELAMGIEVEYEHTSDRAVSEKISRDHLSAREGIPDYYSRLKRMEEEAKGEKEGKPSPTPFEDADLGDTADGHAYAESIVERMLDKRESQQEHSLARIAVLIQQWETGRLYADEVIRQIKEIVK